MADIAATLAGWSSTTGSNAPSGGTTIGTGLDDNLREIQGVIVRGLSHKGADIASATTTDIGAVEGLAHDITGTTTITGLGTVRAGIAKLLQFDGALTLTHNATSLILPGGANITTAAGDVALMFSEGSGNWRCYFYVKASGLGLAGLGTQAANNVAITGGSITGITDLAIADGGTGASTAADAFAALKQAATESATGVVELANNTEALAGSDTTRAVTSAGLASDKSLASSGYMKFPGGLIIQWGASGTSTGGTAGTFPIAFPNNAWKMVATCNNGVAQIQATINSVSGFTLTVNSGTPNASYIAIGN
jgi:hypothetical protein